ncbi:MAG: hypothetical protein IBJ16_00905 [Chitinophagaceae bacterium]|nr:hypothetical protein [Chitinophagaceae bacterium]
MALLITNGKFFHLKETIKHFMFKKEIVILNKIKPMIQLKDIEKDYVPKGIVSANIPDPIYSDEMIKKHEELIIFLKEHPIPAHLLSKKGK